MKKLILVWLLCGFGGTYWARKDPEIIGRPMPLIYWIMGTACGPCSLMSSIIFKFRPFIVKEVTPFLEREF